METTFAPDPVLSRFQTALREMYGDRIERVTLFGSRARGDALPESDYDVALFLKGRLDRWREFERLADLRLKFIDEYGAFFDVLPYPEAAYLARAPLMREIRRDGREL
jgi:predicted nucleotidyltransferase